MKKVLSFLMVCVFAVVFTGVLMGCEANGADDGMKTQKPSEVQQEDKDVETAD
ncbi:MAG: hypothetical protein JXA11_12150 [Phycisphaerae bacterium]|nr:hypothetical protein [Phycisphaerae bacterium]